MRRGSPSSVPSRGLPAPGVTSTVTPSCLTLVALDRKLHSGWRGGSVESPQFVAFRTKCDALVTGRSDRARFAQEEGGQGAPRCILHDGLFDKHGRHRRNLALGAVQRSRPPAVTPRANP